MTDEEKRKMLWDRGWRFSDRIPCKVAGCAAMVEYWVTPGKKGVALDYIGLAPHWISCVGSNRKRVRERVQLVLFQILEQSEPEELDGTPQTDERAADSRTEKGDRFAADAETVQTVDAHAPGKADEAVSDGIHIARAAKQG